MKIIISIVLGVLFGLLMVMVDGVGITQDFIKPFGTIFVNMLKLIAVPLVIVSLINGVAGLKDVASLSRMGGKTVGFYLASTVVSVTIGLVVVNIMQPGKAFPEEKRAELREAYVGESLKKQATAGELKQQGPLSFIEDIVPENFFAAASDNANMLQVIFFALLFGIALVVTPPEKTLTLKNLFSGLNEVILKMVDFIMQFAPYGVFALLAALITEYAGEDMQETVTLFKALGYYGLCVISGLLLMSFIVYPSLIVVFTKLNYKTFLKGILPAQMLGFSTSSSAATLPLTMERCEKHLGVSDKVSSFVLPLGATINMDGTSLYQSVSAVFIAQAFGLELTLSQQLTIVLTATLASIGSAAVPGAGTVMLIIVLESIGLEAEGISLIFALDRPLDMLRTTVNITGDATVASLIAHSEGELKPIIEDTSS